MLAELVAKNDLHGALDAALAAWRETKDPSLAPVVAALGERLATKIAPLPAKQIDAMKAWSAAARSASPDQMTPLLAQLGEFLEAAAGKNAWPCVDVLSELPRDPRVARFALPYVTGEKKPREMTQKMWRRLLDAVEDHGDVELVPALVPIPESHPMARSRIANLIKRIEKGTTVGPRQDALVRAIGAVQKIVPRAAKPVRSGDELLAAIQANPDDDERRQVYADWLMEAGDPRGELITLHLRKDLDEAGRAREAALLKKHLKAWLGPIAKVVSEPVFEKGFLARCTVSANRTNELEAALGRPEWWSVRAIQFRGPSRFSPTLRSLRVALGVSIEALRDYVTQKLDLPLDTVRVVHGWYERTTEPIDRFLAARPVSRLSIQYLHQVTEPVADLAWRFRAAAPGLRELEILFNQQPSGRIASMTDIPAGLALTVRHRSPWDFKKL